MALTVEDGTNVTGADSLVTRQEYIDYAANVGTTIADDEEADQELREAMRVIDSVESRMMGVRERRDQALSFPRGSMVIDGWSYATDEIPQTAKDAQMEIALYINAGNDPYNPVQRKFPKREKVDVIEVEYATSKVAPTQGDRWQILLRKLFYSGNHMTLVRA